MKKVILALFLFFPFIVFANGGDIKNDIFFKSEVLQVVERQKTVLPDGTETEQQNLILRGLEGDFKDKEINFNGIGLIDVLNNNIYEAGDRVLVVASFDADGNVNYYITDYIRNRSLWMLAISFILVLIVIGGLKGLRSIIALAATFLVIVKYIIPQILSGASPLIITLIGSLVILISIIYITEGFRARSHISVISIFFSLIITIIFSLVFVSLSKLTGVVSEEILFLFNISGHFINFKGLLLAGIIIGALGVLDDIVISQVRTAEQISRTNRALNKLEIFKYTYKVGVSHIASMTNTLFLAYAGVSLPLLILFISGESAFSSWEQIINNEAVATEIIRTFAGSIGLILSVPIATFFAAWWYGKRE